MRSVRVSTWPQLQEEVCRDSWNADVAPFRPSVAFRSRDRAGDELTPSLEATRL